MKISEFQIDFINVNNPLQNYMWIIRYHHEIIVIDPTQADLVIQYCECHELKVKQIWITHKHQDHIGGALALQQKYHATVYAPRKELSSLPFKENDENLQLLEHTDEFDCFGLNVQIIETIGHTLGHICYYLPQIDALFCGDTLFAMGCGRVFEGTMQQMHQSLKTLAQLPPQTKVYCTHEYSLSNAEFARHTYPNNAEIEQRYQIIKSQQERGETTLPSTIALENATNPFLLCQNSDEFARLRQLKDDF